ncbi:PREDICTED: translation initiation factor IF-2-like [Chinchilla lanigera]|uniref:translation initiation factor IF-2-like n=1 Tax=Chinchilla lanigera TaxID=34839 RepID=UPI00038EF9FF|nr:PREDICTED: translation initiation factor IF-2-like [Chinchilla lanigera]
MPWAVTQVRKSGCVRGEVPPPPCCGGPRAPLPAMTPLPDVPSAPCSPCPVRNDGPQPRALTFNLGFSAFLRPAPRAAARCPAGGAAASPHPGGPSRPASRFLLGPRPRETRLGDPQPRAAPAHVCILSSSLASDLKSCSCRAARVTPAAGLRAAVGAPHPKGRAPGPSSWRERSDAGAKHLTKAPLSRPVCFGHEFLQ